ncbi:MAG: hypothetical protein A2W03_15300 [Candidatus Aminicenantes bacterium RBG_16_63_16]|nr:MAG: hypothetical protein A2W03_15300 [Candidatus Aminicenantes bacterium RBG_16_63_16]
MRDARIRFGGFFLSSILFFCSAFSPAFQGEEIPAPKAGTVLIGASLPPGVGSLEAFRRLKLGDMVLTAVPRTKAEAVAMAEYCARNAVQLCFSELLYRGGYDLCWAWRERVPRSRFFSRADMEEIIAAAGPCYFGRYVVGEIGCVVYAPEKYAAEFPDEHWSNLPAVRTQAEARDAYVRYIKRFLDFERRELGPGPLINVDAGLIFKYVAEAGADILGLESLPGDPHLMHAAIRGAAKAYDKPWGVHIAMENYGGMRLDELWQKRWEASLAFSYLSGAGFILPESGHLAYTNPVTGEKFPFHSPEVKRVRRALREMYQFARIHRKPSLAPRVRLGVVYGNEDGAPGLWNRAAWGQYGDAKWLEGPAERGWRFVDRFYRKEDWPREAVQGDLDFSGNPPLGQYDLVPAEAPAEILNNYGCLLFLGWNTMTGELYTRLKGFVEQGGRLIMFLPHLSTESDRGRDLKLYGDGDFSDLFGAQVVGRGERKIQGFKYLAESSLPEYRFPVWRIRTDPRFMGLFTSSRVKLTSGKIMAGAADHYMSGEKELLDRPLVIENRLGRGTAFLVTAWEFPGDEGLVPFTQDLVRTVLQGEQADVRLLAGDRVRYAVCEGKAPGEGRGYSVVYLLNADPDTPAPAKLWVRGGLTDEFVIPPNGMRLAYLFDDLVVFPEDRRVDLAAWEPGNGRQDFRFFNAVAQRFEVHNLGGSACRVLINGRGLTSSPGRKAVLEIAISVDPARRAFFAADFLDEPDIDWKGESGPYE